MFQAKKISVIGAGNVGSNIAFLLLMRRLFENILLVDIQKQLTKAAVLDLEDSRFFFDSNTSLQASSKLSDVAGSDMVVITAGKPRSPGMSREELIKINSSIVKKIALVIKKEAPKAIIIVITNPLDLMTYVALRASKFSFKKVIGMGSSLDSSRFANLISKKIKLGIQNINPVVFGTHGKDMLISSKSTISGFELSKFLNKKSFSSLQTQTLNRGATIVNLLKKGSARFGPAAAAVDLIESIIYDSKKVTFVSCYLSGQYNLKDICLGIPAIVGSSGVEKILEFSISKKEKSILKQAGAAFKKLAKSL